MAFPRRPIVKTSDGAAVALTTGVIVPANASRQEITIVNDGSNDVYLAFSTVIGQAPIAVLGKGIYLKSGGGSWTSTSYVGAVAAIAKTSTSSVTILDI